MPLQVVSLDWDKPGWGDESGRLRIGSGFANRFPRGQAAW